MAYNELRFLFPSLFSRIATSRIHTSPVTYGKMLRSSVYKPTKNRDLPLTYEMANPAYQIGVRKSWNSWNTSNLWEGTRRYESSWEDLLIRKFMHGVFPKLVASEVIIKRQFNTIRIACLVSRSIMPRKMYFLVGFSEEMLSNMLKCPVKMEIQTIESSVFTDIYMAASDIGETTTCLSLESADLKALGHTYSSYQDMDDYMLSSRFRPLSGDMILGNIDSVNYIKSWLSDWSRKPTDPAGNYTLKPRRKVRLEESDSDFEPDSDDDSSSDNENVGNKALLILGPCGCGKTSTVYTLCQEQHFKVVEINSSSVRSGKILIEQFKAATGMHRVDANSLFKESSWNIDAKSKEVNKVPVKDAEGKSKLSLKPIENGKVKSAAKVDMKTAFHNLFASKPNCKKETNDSVVTNESTKTQCNGSKNDSVKKISGSLEKQRPIDNWFSRPKAKPASGPDEKTSVTVSVVPEMPSAPQSTDKKRATGPDHVPPSVAKKRKNARDNSVVVVDSDDESAADSILIEDSDSDDFQVKKRRTKKSKKFTKTTPKIPSDSEDSPLKMTRPGGGLALELKTLYLIDEADVAFMESDVGFASALCRLIQAGEKPFILTASSLKNIDRQLLNCCYVVEMSRPSEDDLCKHLAAMLISMGKSDIDMTSLKSLVTESKCDVRRALNILQFSGLQCKNIQSQPNGDNGSISGMLPSLLPARSFVRNLQLRSELDALLSEADMRWSMTSHLLKDSLEESGINCHQNMLDHRDDRQNGAGNTLNFLAEEFVTVYGSASDETASPSELKSTMPCLCHCLHQLVLGSREGFSEHLLCRVGPDTLPFHDRSRLMRFVDCTAVVRDICRSEAERKLTCNDRQRRRFFHYLTDCGITMPDLGLKCLQNN